MPFNNDLNDRYKYVCPVMMFRLAASSRALARFSVPRLVPARCPASPWPLSRCHASTCTGAGEGAAVVRCVVASKNAVKVQATESTLKAAFPTDNFVVEGEQGSCCRVQG